MSKSSAALYSHSCIFCYLEMPAQTISPVPHKRLDSYAVFVVFNGRTFCRKRLCRKTFSRKDILPTGVLPNRRFDEQTFCRTDSLTNRQLAENRDIF